MYSQDFINIFGEINIQNWLLMDRKTLKNTYEFMIENPNKFTNKEELSKIIAFENYCIKYASHTKTKLEQNIIDNLLEFLFKNYIINPIGLNESLLFKSENLDKLFPKEKVNKLKKAKEKYKERAKIIMVKHAKGKEITEDEKSILMHFYIDNINTDNKPLQNIIKNYIIEMLNNLDKVSENKNEILFLCKFASIYMIKLYNSENKKEVPLPNIYITSDKDNENGYLIKNHIFININTPFNKNIPNLLQAIFHECQHAIQNFDAYHDKNSIKALEWTQNELFTRYVKNNSIQNHYLLGIEKDAEKEGFNYAKLFYLCYGKEGKDTKGLAGLFREENKLFKTNIHPFDYRIDDNTVPKEYYNVKHMNEIIYKHPKLLRKYPVLNNIYEKNGEVKSIENFLKDYGITKDTKYNLIYNDYIIDAIFKDKLLTIKIKHYTNKVEANIFSNLINIFSKEIEKVEEMVNYLKLKEEINIDNHDILIIGNYHVTIIIKILDFLKRNNKLFKTLENNGILNMDYFNSYTIKTKITEFDDFLKTVKSRTILEDSLNALTEKIKEYAKTEA